MKKQLRPWRRLASSVYFRIYRRGWLVLFLALSCAAAVCLLLRNISDSDVHVPMIFVLAVMMVSLWTDGFFYGFLAAGLSVLGVNYAFTYPYLKLDFSITGYPLTFLTMLAVGFATSTLTSRLKLQEKLRVESEKEKIRANLLRAISHDLRTPLTAIGGSITAVLEDGGNLDREQQRDLLLSARRDTEWLYRMVENLLSITRIGDTGGCSITKEDEVLEEVLAGSVSDFRKRRGEVPVSVRVPEEVLILPMDAMLMEQVLLNLLDNAAVHAQGLTRIVITARREGSSAVISVSDDGCGIDPERLKTLFDGRGNIDRQHPADGSKNMGIGLSVCRTIVEAHGGTVSARNRREGGAEFIITLPMEDVP